MESPDESSDSEMEDLVAKAVDKITCNKKKSGSVSKCDSSEKTVKPANNDRITLSSKIHSSVNLYDNYLKKPTQSTVKKTKESTIQNLIKGSDKDSEIMKKSVLQPDIEKKYALPPYQESLQTLKKQRKKDKEMTKGKGWFNMTAPEMTEETKNDLTVLQMRRALDPKRFYKSNDIKTLPKFFQFGKVIENSADFYHSRVPKKQRKSTMVDELLADAEFRTYNKRKYVEIQEAKRKGAGPYKHMKRLKNRKR
ncbi:deoxynucleotidyltransferase terminal-interacting protein 2-like [Mizuhopecten yessoensis]|uniref:Deoxynucleotidyltransferase terminal-interacting protein 2 n=1 Tax=Mizuhopecten yessoensis TaxID=6573 RepID=A0A210QP52_MIZYE|nr:deoxynucleotidyltransferase terminal-interacting protein 2-like [Mizuhopecten yessoensis]OWF50519.1 Deoxynucleotidyltransferase terminal-interacting protein 2 [Mizuhopecten yessoensis]